MRLSGFNSIPLSSLLRRKQGINPPPKEVCMKEKIKNFSKKFGEGTAWDLDYGKLLIIGLLVYLLNPGFKAGLSKLVPFKCSEPYTNA